MRKSTIIILCRALAHRDSMLRDKTAAVVFACFAIMALLTIAVAAKEKRAEKKGGDMSDMMLMMMLSDAPAVAVMSPWALLTVGAIAASLSGFLLTPPTAEVAHASKASLLY